MEAQTLQQQTPIYHVCQHCGGEGCAACSDLLILDGDIQLDPEWSDDLPAVAPINGVIGITARAKSSCQCDDPDAKFYCIQCHPYWGYGDTSADPSSFEVPACPHCGKIDYDLACDCLNPVEYSPAVGDWVCGKKTAAPSPKPAPKYDISFDDRNIYQRREDELRLAGEWEV